MDDEVMYLPSEPAAGVSALVKAGVEAPAPSLKWRIRKVGAKYLIERRVTILFFFPVWRQAGGYWNTLEGAKERLKEIIREESGPPVVVEVDSNGTWYER